MMENIEGLLPDLDELTPLVRQVMRIDDITSGDPKKGYLARYRGQIYGDSGEAYDRLSATLNPLSITPLFRKEEDQHVVMLMPGVNQAKPSNPKWNVVMFILTVISVWFTGAILENIYANPQGIGEYIIGGLPFAVSMMAILLCHEFGHYIVGRLHNTQVSLPYFIPFPLSPFGTMGAFIQMKEQPRNRRVLMDIGIAGPLAGLAVAIPVLFLGLYLSRLDTISTAGLQPGQGFTIEGNSLLYLFAKFVVFGRLLPSPVSYQGLSPLLYWIRYFFTSQPLPEGGIDVIIHPVAWAGWAGLLVTSLNLIPAGQLDGGHLVYVLLGQKRARMLWPFILVGLVLLGFAWTGWWLWAALIFFLGRLYAEPLDTITPLDSSRKLLAMFGILVFLLVFIPVPLVSVLGK
jgi:Zn-dependent protease